MSRPGRVIALVASACALALLVTFVVQTSSTERFEPSKILRTYNSEEMGVQLTFPESWLRSTDQKGHILKLVSPTHPSARSPAVIQVNPLVFPESVSSLPDVGEWQMKQWTAQMSELVRTEPAQSKVNGLSVYKAGITFHSTGSEAREQHLYYFFVSGRKGVTVACGALQEDFKFYVPDFEAIVQSFHWKFADAPAVRNR